MRDIKLVILAVALVSWQTGEARTTPALRLVASEVSRTELAPPWTLTAADGAELVLARVDAKAVVEGPLAFTELHLYFHNSSARTREGTFAITLPPGASVSRFAMETAGRWQEAEVVDKLLARRAYEDFLHRRQDPALLEKAAGNQFTARVFPIPGNSDKQLVVSFAQELTGDQYSLPLRGLPTIARVDAHLAITGSDGARHEVSLTERNWRPDRDLVAPVGPAAVSAGELVVGSFAMPDRGVADPPKELTLLVDTSASRALGFARYVTSIHELIDALGTRYGGALPVQVIAFDQDTERIFDGTASQYSAREDNALLARSAAGASDLGQALDAIAATAPHRRLVIVTDGVMTAGPETGALAAAVHKLPIDRADVVLAGGIRDDALAASLARPGLAHPGDVYDLDRGSDAVAAGLGEAVRQDVAIAVPGATWVYPTIVPAARPGAIVMVHARLAKPGAQLEVVMDGERRTARLGAATPALVERANAGAAIDELEARLAATTIEADAGKLRAEIAKLSVAARVVSSQTSLLVLESDTDYEQYRIDRRALAGVLSISAHGIELQHRAGVVAGRASARVAAPIVTSGRGTTDAAPPEEPKPADQPPTFASLVATPPAAAPVDDSNPFGLERGPSTASTAASSRGQGVGHGRGVTRSRTAAVPTVSIGAPMSMGSLDKNFIRRYIHQHVEQITYCYERRLEWNPKLAGTVTVQFFITPDGDVSASSAQGFDSDVGSCVAGVIKDIKFPKQGGGGIQVNYPFAFRSSTTPAEPVDPIPALVAAGLGGKASPPAEPVLAPALTGTLADVMDALAHGRRDRAVALASAWHDREPGDVLALVGFGEALEANRDLRRAARIYGSIIDLFPARADLRRFAGERLERIGFTRKLAIDTYRRAVADRPDHLTGHRLLAYALLRDHDYAAALTAILVGFDQPYAGDRFRGGTRVLGEDAGMIAAVYVAHGGDRVDIAARLAKRGLTIDDEPSTRFILYWETDANDVDLHVVDRDGNHAFYREPKLASGGELFADVTTGYGPECFAVTGEPRGGPYRLSINYYSQGPMGYGMGLVQVQKFDGKDLAFDDRPYVVMTSQATLDLGIVR